MQFIQKRNRRTKEEINELKKHQLLCNCGCGEYVKWNKHKNKWNVYIRGHNVVIVKHTDKSKEKMSIGRKGKTIGKNHPQWKGGYNKKDIPMYNTFAHQIEWTEEVRRSEQDSNILEVKCFKCNEWYIPSLNNVNGRIQHIKGNYNSESHFYCSKKCKNSCSIFGKTPETLIKEDAIRAGRLPWLELTREVQSELRKLVLERDGYKCVKCGSEEPLHCHHIYPVSTNPLESTDIDNCITLCIDCHKKVHQKDGCQYNQLNICIE